MKPLKYDTKDKSHQKNILVGKVKVFNKYKFSVS